MERLQLGARATPRKFVSDFKDLRERPDRPVDPSLWGNREKQRSNFLYSILASLVRQRPLALIKQVKQANGLEAYRLLIKSLEPASKNRSLGECLRWQEGQPAQPVAQARRGLQRIRAYRHEAR